MQSSARKHQSNWVIFGSTFDLMISMALNWVKGTNLSKLLGHSSEFDFQFDLYSVKHILSTHFDQFWQPVW